MLTLSAPSAQPKRVTWLPAGVFSGKCAHPCVYPSPPPAISGSHRGPQQSDEFEPFLEPMSEFADLPGAAAEPFGSSQLRGAQGGSGDFWVWEGAAEILGCLCYVVSRDEGGGGGLLPKAIYSR